MHIPPGGELSPRNLVRWNRGLGGAADLDQRSPQCGGGKEIRTPDIVLAKHVLYQLSYTPRWVLPGAALLPRGKREWWAYVDSNHRPPAYQAGALTN